MKNHLAVQNLKKVTFQPEIIMTIVSTYVRLHEKVFYKENLDRSPICLCLESAFANLRKTNEIILGPQNFNPILDLDIFCKKFWQDTIFLSIRQLLITSKKKTFAFTEIQKIRPFIHLETLYIFINAKCQQKPLAHTWGTQILSNLACRRGLFKSHAFSKRTGSLWFCRRLVYRGPCSHALSMVCRYVYFIDCRPLSLFS